MGIFSNLAGTPRSSAADDNNAFDEAVLMLPELRAPAPASQPTPAAPLPTPAARPAPRPRPLPHERRLLPSRRHPRNKRGPLCSPARRRGFGRSRSPSYLSGGSPIGKREGRGLLQHNSLAVVPQPKQVLSLSYQQLQVRQEAPKKEHTSKRKRSRSCVSVGIGMPAAG